MRKTRPEHGRIGLIGDGSDQDAAKTENAGLRQGRDNVSYFLDGTLKPVGADKRRDERPALALIVSYLLVMRNLLQKLGCLRAYIFLFAACVG